MFILPQQDYVILSEMIPIDIIDNVMFVLVTRVSFFYFAKLKLRFLNFRQTYVTYDVNLKQQNIQILINQLVFK